MKKLISFILFFCSFLTTQFTQAQIIDVRNLSEFVIKNADSVYVDRDSFFYSLWYPEQGILVSVSHSNMVKSAVKIANYNLFTVDLAEVYLALSQVDSIQLIKDKKLQFDLEKKLQEWCNKKRSFEGYQYVKDSDIWEKLKFKIQIIPNPEADCREYYFFLGSSLPIISNDIMRIILDFFKDD